MTLKLPRLLLAAPASGGGKTTLTCGLLQLFQNKKMQPGAFKCGPDYIDPLFHTTITGSKSGNLDLFFTNEETVCSLLDKGAKGCGIALLEGVMGYYDGISPDSPDGSSYHVAKATKTPVVLVLESKGAALSVAAQVYGFAQFMPDANIQGVILNKCSEGLYQYLAPGIEKNTGIPVLGYVPYDEEYRIESRHLGLVTAEEIEGLKSKLQRLAATLQQTLNIEKLLAIANATPPLSYTEYKTDKIALNAPRLAVAKDAAFCFYYAENLRILQEMGAELVFFSPLYDRELPPDIQGIYLGGGYPELYAEGLANNTSMKRSICNAIQTNIPVVAECGGFLYLQKELLDEQGVSWPMLGVLAGKSQNAGRLKQFGYITITAQQDNLYCRAGESIAAHEFHYWHSSHSGTSFCAKKPKRDVEWSCMVAQGNLVAGFPHLYYPANPCFAAKFVRALSAAKTK